jgi:hypothetical protein
MVKGTAETICKLREQCVDDGETEAEVTAEDF